MTLQILTVQIKTGNRGKQITRLPQCSRAAQLYEGPRDALCQLKSFTSTVTCTCVTCYIKYQSYTTVCDLEK